jgi:hypothetical protein
MSDGIKRLICGFALVVLETFAAGRMCAGQVAPKPIPVIAEKNGHFALMVDGDPFLMLGVQANNSSAWPEYLGKVWPAAETLHANTVELPVYWEQVEAEQGKFDFSLVDTILKQAREHKQRLVLLWFGTWKNGSSHYTPEWVKADQEKYPFVRRQDGQTVDSPSTFSPARLEADKKAFAALMRHLKEADGERTVLMVQVENEVGVWGAVRDFGAAAEKAFAGAVPEKLVKGLGKQPGTWKQVFGDDADEDFQAWCIATYVEEVAAAGKAEYPLPLYVNAALRDPFHAKVGDYESGAPTDNQIDLWKVAAPSISVVAPDIYLAEYPKYMKAMELYGRKGNALLIPETGNPAEFARYVYAAIGKGAIGWAPFGLDLTGYSNQASGPLGMEASALTPFARQYALLAPMQRKLAHWMYEGRLVKGSSENPEVHRETLEFKGWNAVVSYGLPSFGDWVQPKGNSPADGGVIVVQVFPDEFLVTGHHARVDFAPLAAGKKRLFIRVEEQHMTPERDWVMDRIWNGDQTDWGLNLKADEDVVLRVRVGTF